MPLRDVLADGVTDLLDLVLSRACLDCDEPGRVLCRACLARLRGRPLELTGPLGLPVVAALPYAPHGRRLVVDYKEHGLRALAPMLGTLLADAVTRQARLAGARRIALVPVPAHPWSPRGFDALGGIVRAAARDLRARALVPTVERPVVVHRYRALKDLDRAARAKAIRGAFRPRQGWCPQAGIELRLVVDDIVTTGATTGELAAVLVRTGLPVAGIAAIAAVSPGTPVPNPAPAPPTPPR